MSLIPFHSDERADCADHTLFRTVPIGIVIAVETFPEVDKNPNSRVSVFGVDSCGG